MLGGEFKDDRIAADYDNYQVVQKFNTENIRGTFSPGYESACQCKRLGTSGAQARTAQKGKRL